MQLQFTILNEGEMQTLNLNREKKRKTETLI